MRHLDVEPVRLGDLRPYPGNARRGSVQHIVESLEAHGQYRALVVQRSTGRVLVGNHTLQALQRLRWPTAEVTYLDVDDDQARRIALVDNRTSDLATYDDQELLALLQQVGDDLTGTAFVHDDVSTMLAALGLSSEPLRLPEDEPDTSALGTGAVPVPDSVPIPAPTLADRFVVPPFTVLDGRGGAWMERKRRWLSLGIRSEVGRGGELVYTEPQPYEVRTHDVSEGSPLWVQARHALRQAVSAKGWTHRQVDDHLGTNGMAGHYLGDSQPGVPTPDQWARLAQVLELPAALWLPMTQVETRSPAESAELAWSKQQGAGRTPHRTVPPAGLTVDSASGRVPTYYAQKEAAELRAGRPLSHEEFTRDHLDASGASENLSTSGTSVFDPVLVELAVRWFAPPTGHVLDPFAGGSVRGIVTTQLGRSYEGVELRAEQVAANEEQRSLAPFGADLTWHVGDSRELDTDGRPADLLLTCPPYAYLERYSDDPADLSTMSWDDFRDGHREVIERAVTRLRDDRYIVWVVGEVRSKGGDGHSVGLIADTIDAFQSLGCDLYNELIYVTPVGSLPVRVGRQFTRARKAGRTHQHVLVFVKGDGMRAADACGAIEVQLPPGWEQAIPDRTGDAPERHADQPEQHADDDTPATL